MFSVIIPTCDRNDLLRLCLEHLSPEKQTLDSSLYEIWVSDDGSKNTAEELIRKDFPWVYWTRGPQRGPAANRNNGASFSQGEWLVFIDDDCLPEHKLLENYHSAVSRNLLTTVFEGRIYADRIVHRMDEEAPINENGGYLWSCNFCIKSSVFKFIKGFDEGFIYAAMEDVDFRKRLDLLNVEIKFVRDASVMHPWRKISGKEVYYKRLVAHEYYFKKYPVEKTKIGLRYVFSSLKNVALTFLQNILSLEFRGYNILRFRVMFIFRLYILANYKKH